MTLANQKRLELLAKDLQSLAKVNPRADMALHTVFMAQKTLMIIVEDLYYRSKENS